MKRFGLLAICSVLLVLVTACAPTPTAPQNVTSSQNATVPVQDSSTESSTTPATTSEEPNVTSPARTPPTQADILPDSIPALTGFTQTIHDPVIAEENGKYYVFSTGARIIIICSDDMLAWEFCGRVFDENPAWTREINPNLADLWAPDISYFNGKWHLYFSASNFGQQNSAIALATNTTLDPESPDYKWVDEGIVLRSNVGDPWNAIDANLVFDADGNPWLNWGSYWTGLYIRRIDPATGKFDEANPDVHHIASRRTPPEDSTAIEAPFIMRRDGYYYLFASFDQCCMGVNSTYNVRVGRSESITGPYIDADGVPMLESGGTLILREYGRWKGPGHNGMLIRNQDSADQEEWIVYHAYDRSGAGVPKLRIERIHWDEQGWPWLPSQVPAE